MRSRKVNNGISLLNFDETLQNQPLLQEYPNEWIDFSDLHGCNGYCTVDSLCKIQHRLKSRNYKNITLIGNGNYHYVTYVLLSEIQQPFCLILFDHHTDLAHGDIPLISCGSWVSMALKTLPLLQRVVIIGAHPTSGYQSFGGYDKVIIISEQEVCRTSISKVVWTIRSILPNLPLYISVDKDVLNRENAITNWDQGSMTLLQLLDMLWELKRTFPILGIDICGELPLSPVDVLSDRQIRYVKKNEIANKAILDVLLAG